MKRVTLYSLLLCSWVLNAEWTTAQDFGPLTPSIGQRNLPPESEYSIEESGPHHRKWSRVVWETDAAGNQIAKTNSYIELASGMNYLRGNKWVPAREEIEGFANGAVARWGQ